MTDNPIRNTTADMNAPDSTDRSLLFLTAVATGSPSGFIENQERAGQQQLVRSEMLPTDTRGTADAEYEAVGFAFGEPLADDPMFRPTTLPAGWSKRGGDHDMWSYVVDELGRYRVAVFYKAAFYDRSAFMRLIGVSEYVYSHVGGYQGYANLTPDETWATPAAIVEAAREHAKGIAEEIAECQQWLAGDMPTRVDYARKYLPEKKQRHAKYLVLAERFGGDVDD